jgi:predicted molibdopterin-dependent oxidoreductase YjgC
MAAGHTFAAYLPGGASGGILPASMNDIPLDFGTLEKYGRFIGSAAVGQSTCVACGECVQACPMGALMPSAYLDDHQMRVVYPDREVDSLCPYCGVGCQVSYKVKDERNLYAEGRNGPANQNRLCVKGRFGFDYVHRRLQDSFYKREPRGGHASDKFEQAALQGSAVLLTADLTRLRTL